MKMRWICATPYLGEELLGKVGIFERTPKKKVETPRKKENPLNRNIMNQEKYNERLKIGLEQGLEHGIEGKIELLYIDLHLTIVEIAQKLKVSEEYVQRVVDGIEGKD